MKLKDRRYYLNKVAQIAVQMFSGALFALVTLYILWLGA